MSFSDMLKDIGVSIAILAGFVVGGKAVIFLLNHIVKTITEKTPTTLDDKILAVVKKPAFGMIILWGAYISVSRLSADFPGAGLLRIADNAVFIIAIAIVVKVSYDVLGAVLEWYGQNASAQGNEGVRKSIIPLLKKLVKVFAAISGLIVVLDHFSYNITSLVTALGVSSLAVGLAAKETLSNMISGFTIVLDRPFRIGDRIEVEGKVGDIVEIGIRSTRMMMLDNSILIIPNTKLAENVVLNFSNREYSVVGNVNVQVDYTSDVSQVRAALLSAAAGVPEINGPQVFFLEHGEHGLNFMLAYAVPNLGVKVTVQDALNTAINKQFRAAGIKFSVPVRKIYLQNADMPQVGNA